MEQFIKEWWGFGVGFIFAAMLFLKLLSASTDAWKGGDWKSATLKTVGPVLSLLFFTTVGMTAVSIGFSNTYSVVKDSIPAQGLISLGNAATSLIAGGLDSAPSIEVPQTSSLVEIIQNASEAIAPQTNAPASAPASIPASNVESAAPASNWGVVREAPVAPTREVIGPVAPTVAPPAPTQGPAPRVEGPQEKPTFVDPGSVFGGGGPQTYTVKSGDSMAKIAKAVGLPDYRAICAANRAIVGNDCNVIRSGQVLVIP